MTSNQKILAGVAGVGAIILVVYALSKDAPKGTTTPATTDTTASGTSKPTGDPHTAAAPPSTPSTAPTDSTKPGPITSGAPVDMETLAQEAKQVEAARAALRGGDPKKALVELDRYDKIPGRGSLKQEAALIKIEALSKTGRRTDALVLGMSTRDDPSFAPYRGRVDAVLEDAGLTSPGPGPTTGPP